MSYGTFAPHTSSVHHRREASSIRLVALLLVELIANTIASFGILAFLLYLAGIEYAPVLALQVTFGFTCLVFVLLQVATAVWHTYRYHARGYEALDDGEMPHKSPMKDLETGLTLEYEK
ncbi:hypothetical protein B0H16DRAFT_1528389 [Mycena metata]|uniref:Uncharacterized protein n=1 Tax=Mycena metata TaxID=1033252 RepID=A0AAD7JGR5_9AGAR|nr:hypothetical protein B0H16DRAFT_1528389 [Mycena metata]